MPNSAIRDVIEMNIVLYFAPMLMAHLMAASLQTVSLLVAGSMLTASIRYYQRVETF